MSKLRSTARKLFRRKLYFLSSLFNKCFQTFGENDFRFLVKKFQQVDKTVFYVSGGIVCGKKFFSKKFWNVLNPFGFWDEKFQSSIRKTSTVCLDCFLRVQKDTIKYNFLKHLSISDWLQKLSKKFRTLGKNFPVWLSKLHSTRLEERFSFLIYISFFDYLWILRKKFSDFGLFLDSHGIIWTGLSKLCSTGPTENGTLYGLTFFEKIFIVL